MNGFEVEKIVWTSNRAFKTIETEVYDFIEKYPEQKNHIYRLAGVVGVHAGPNMVGYCITPDYSKVTG